MSFWTDVTQKRPLNVRGLACLGMLQFEAGIFPRQNLLYFKLCKLMIDPSKRTLTSGVSA